MKLLICHHKYWNRLLFTNNTVENKIDHFNKRMTENSGPLLLMKFLTVSMLRMDTHFLLWYCPENAAF